MHLLLTEGLKPLPFKTKYMPLCATHAREVGREEDKAACCRVEGWLAHCGWVGLVFRSWGRFGVGLRCCAAERCSYRSCSQRKMALGRDPAPSFCVEGLIGDVYVGDGGYAAEVVDLVGEDDGVGELFGGGTASSAAMFM